MPKSFDPDVSQTNNPPDKPASASAPAGQTSEPPAPIATLERKLEGHTGRVYSVAVSPDGKWAVSGSGDKTVKIWDLETGECRATLEGHTGEVHCVAVTPDGKRILSGASDNTIRVWDAQSGQPTAILTSKIFVNGIALLPGNYSACHCYTE